MFRSLILAATALQGALASYGSINTETVTFDNERRFLFDTNGNQVDAYGSKVQMFNGTYYLYGNGFSVTGAAYGINLYSSNDLTNWVDQGNILSSAATATCTEGLGGCGRPHMLYNSVNDNYVLWLNGGSSGYLVATADAPTGPFDFTSEPASIDPAFAALQPADFTIEQNGTDAYLVFSALNFRYAEAGSLWPPIEQSLHISKLTDDYQNTTTVSYNVRSSDFDLIDDEAESPDLFFRNGLFYVAASNTCGYCNGSIGLIYRSSSIEGPWTRQIIAGHSCRGQVEGVASLVDPTSGETTYLWHSTSVPGGPRVSFSGHIFQPLKFNADDSVQDLDCSADASFSVTFEAGSTAATTGAALTAGDATPALAAYKTKCDSDTFILYQTWTASKSGTLTSVSVNIAKSVQTVPLTMTVFNNFTSVTELIQPNFKYNALGTASYSAANLTYTFDNATVFLTTPVAVTEGDYLAVSIAGADYAPYCHLEFDDSAYPQFKLFQQGQGQNSWRGLRGEQSVVYERVGKSVKFFATYE